MTTPMRRPIGRRLMPIALLGSVGLNLFLGGFLLGRPHHHGGPPPPERFIERVAETLPDADAAILRRAMAEHREDFGRDHARRDDFIRQVQALLSAEPFDPKAMQSLFAAHDRAEQDFRDRLQKDLIAAATEMSPEGRHRLATFRPEGRRP
ncbi:periplasmic heavy metal sensor [Azospirillum sp. sgz302134]